MTKHSEHEELIAAFKAGAKIQVYSESKGWLDTPNPSWINGTVYRVKPEEACDDMESSQSNRPHKHAAVITAWADGEEVDYKLADGTWVGVERPSWLNNTEYRVRPVVRRSREHAELIKRWADGATIEARSRDTGEWLPCPNPRWFTNTTYRVAPSKLAVRFAVIRDCCGELRISVIYLDSKEEDTAGASFFGDGDEIVARSEIFHICLE